MFAAVLMRLVTFIGLCYFLWLLTMAVPMNLAICGKIYCGW